MQQPLKIFITGILLPAFFLSARASSPSIAYTFTKRDSSSLLITLSFSGNKEGTARLILPNEWAGQEKLYTAVSGLQALSKNTAISPTDTPWIYNVSFRPNAKVSVSYVLSKDWPGELAYPKYFRPVIMHGYFYFEGYSGLVYPEMDDTIPLRCTLTYSGFGDTAFKGNSFFAGANSNSFSATLNNLRNGIYCGGSYA